MCIPSDLNILCQGPLEIKMKGRVVQSYVVLLEDRLDFHRDVSEHMKGKEPRSTVFISSIKAFEQTAEGFSLHLREEKHPLQLHGLLATGTWASCLGPLLTKAIEARMGENVNGQSAEPHFGTANGVEPTHEANELRIVYRGALDMVKRNKSKSRYFVLYEDHLEYFSMRDEFIRQMDPLCHVLLDDVQGVEVTESCDITIKLVDREFNLRASDTRDTERWANAWNDALSACSAVSHGVRVRVVQAHTPRTIIEAESDEEDGEVSLPDTGQLKLCAGMFGISRNNKSKVERRYIVLFPDRLEYYTDSFAMGNGDDPRARIMLQDVNNVEVVPVGLRLQAADRVFTLHMNEWDAECWRYNLSRMLDSVKPRASAPVEIERPAPAVQETVADRVLAKSAALSEKREPREKARVAEPLKANGRSFAKEVEKQSVAGSSSLVEQRPKAGDSASRTYCEAPSNHSAADTEGSVYSEASSAPRSRAESPTRARGSTPRRSRSTQDIRMPDTGIPCPSRSSTPRARSKDRLVRGSSIPPPPVRRVCEGTLQVGPNAQRHVVLYETRLELYKDAADSLKQVKPLDCILFSDILDFRVEEMGFQIKMDGNRSQRFIALEAYEFYEWLHAWGQVPVNVIGSRFSCASNGEDNSFVSEVPSSVSEAPTASSCSATMATQLKRRPVAAKATPRDKTPPPTSARESRARSSGGSGAVASSRVAASPKPTTVCTPRQVGAPRQRSAPRLERTPASASMATPRQLGGRAGPGELPAESRLVGPRRHSTNAERGAQKHGMEGAFSTGNRRSSAPSVAMQDKAGRCTLRNGVGAGFGHSQSESSSSRLPSEDRREQVAKSRQSPTRRQSERVEAPLTARRQAVGVPGRSLSCERLRTHR